MSALRKNVGSQVLTFALVNATTGAALTGATVTVKATLDGTQAAGAGTVTELGSGQYKYVPTQGETNGTTLGVLLTATNAIPVNLHCFITAADPTDSVRLGLTALPNAAAGANGGLPLGDASGRVDLGKWIGTAPAAVTASGYVQSAVLRWLTDNAAGTPSALNNNLVQADVERWGNAVVNALIAGRVDANAGVVGDKTAYALSAAGVQAIWDALTANLTTANSIGKRLADDIDATVSSRSTLAAGAAMTLTVGEENAIRDAIFARAFSAAYSNLTFDQIVKLCVVALAAKCSGMATATGTFRNLADTADVIVATIDGNGNRSAVVVTP